MLRERREPGSGEPDSGQERPLPQARRGTAEGADGQLELAVLMHDFSGTGVVRNAQRIAGAARRAGIATEIWTVSPAGQFSERVPPGVSVVTLGAGRPRTPRGRQMTLAIPALALALRRRRPRLLLSAGNHAHAAATWAVLLSRRPGGLRFLGRASNALAPQRRARQKPVAALWTSLRYRFKHGRMDRIIAVSDEMRRSLTEEHDLPPGKITVIPNGVDVAKVAELAAEPLADGWLGRPEIPVIVAAGRLVPQKNFPLLIDAFAELRKERAVRLMLLGDGPDGAREKLAAQAAALGVSEDVRFAGFVGNPYAYFSHAAVVAIPSLWEGASNVLLEAMACGAHVVASAQATGAAEVLDDGRFGTLVAGTDPASFARALAEAIDSPQPREQILGRAAEYDLEASLAAYVRLFEEELGR